MIFNWEEVTLAEFGVWEVLVRVVPPTATYRWQRKLKIPPKPDRPIAEYESVAGHTERVAALPESKEYDEYLRALGIWEKAKDEAELEDLVLGSEFAYDYALVAWRLKGAEDWLTQPPEDWAPADAYGRHDVEARDDRRVEFVLNVILNTEDRLKRAGELMYPHRPGDEGDTAPITQEEVDAAVALFQPGDEIPRAAGRLGSGSTQARGGERQDVQPGKRVATGRRQGLVARFLVWANQRSQNTGTGLG